jgi:hypothetical protein
MIRAIALQAAAAFCKSGDAEHPSKMRRDPRTLLASSHDVIRVADRFELFITMGKVSG